MVLPVVPPGVEVVLEPAPRLQRGRGVRARRAVPAAVEEVLLPVRENLWGPARLRAGARAGGNRRFERVRERKPIPAACPISTG